MTTEERKAKEARFKDLCFEQDDQCNECPVRPTEICDYKIVEVFSDDELDTAINQLEKFGAKPTEAKMTREELRNKMDELCAKQDDGCYKCPCEDFDVCTKTEESLTDEDYIKGIKAFESLEKNKVGESTTDASKVPLHLTEEPTQGSEFDVVERPQHYASTSIECIDAMRETQGIEATKDFCICNAFKYLWRHNSKNGDEDIKKASWYLNKAVELMGKEN